jgi:tetratricopeptide (TPR) repeat protein
MSTLWIQRFSRALAVAGLCLICLNAIARQNTTVLGPSNADLHAGANALLAGDAEEGVRLTLLGLRYEGNSRNRVTGLSNLCAGYIMLGQPEEGLKYCAEVLEQDDQYWRAYSNRALAYMQLDRLEEAEQDLQKAEAIAANARTVKIVRSMLLDKTDPVAPQVVIDDRREPIDDDEE